MTEQLTPGTVAANLLDLSRLLMIKADELDGLEVDAVNAREDYTLAYSKAFLGSEGSVEARKHTAVLATHTERITAELAETRVRNHKRQMDTLKVRVDVGRSAAAALRAEIDLAR